jgi:hypothetical protein
MSDRPVGHGLPWWLPTDLYMTADETRSLPPTRHTNGRGTCLRCDRLPGGPTFRLEGAHAVRKMMGGRGDGKEGPTAELCPECHHELDADPNQTLAVRRDTEAVVWLTHVDGAVIESSLLADHTTRRCD